MVFFSISPEPSNINLAPCCCAQLRTSDSVLSFKLRLNSHVSSPACLSNILLAANVGSVSAAIIGFYGALEIYFLLLCNERWTMTSKWLDVMSQVTKPKSQVLQFESQASLNSRKLRLECVESKSQVRSFHLWSFATQNIIFAPYCVQNHQKVGSKSYSWPPA